MMLEFTSIIMFLFLIKKITKWIKLRLYLLELVGRTIMDVNLVIFFQVP